MSFYLEETSEFSNYTLKLFINKYINSHLYQEASLYLSQGRKSFFLFRDSYKNNCWLKRSEKMLTLKVSLIFLEVLMNDKRRSCNRKL